MHVINVMWANEIEKSVLKIVRDLSVIASISFMYVNYLCQICNAGNPP